MNDPMKIVRKSSYAEAAKLSRETGEPVITAAEDGEYLLLSVENERRLALRELDAALDEAEACRKHEKPIPAGEVLRRLKKKHEAL